MLPAEPRCPSCKYDLTGIVHEHEPISCPECGETFDPANPFGLKPWPNTLRLASFLSLPTAAAFIANRGIGTLAWDEMFRGAAQLERFAIVTVQSILLFAWIVWPGIVALHYVKRCAHPGERGILWTLLTLSGIGLSALVMLALAFIALLG